MPSLVHSTIEEVLKAGKISVFRHGMHLAWTYETKLFRKSRTINQGRGADDFERGGIALFTTAVLLAQTRQEEIAKRGPQVMPFDLEQTVHVFQKLDDGGLQKVVVKDPSNKKQIVLIQSHLKEELERFRKGDFSDPAKIHGEDMPGLAGLKAGAGKIDVRYAALPDGAQIRYSTKDPAMVAALHRWFDAQLSDHGHHAAAQ